MKPITFLLIPGLNDTKPLAKQFYSWICHLWNRKGRQTHISFMDWDSDEQYKEKLKKINHRLLELRQQGREVVLVGVSAGATLAILALADSKSNVFGVVTICGLLRLAPGDDKKIEYFHKSWYQAAQACEKVIAGLDELQSQRVICVIPLRDDVVSPKRAKISGATVVSMKSVGHLASIVVALLFYRRKIWRAVAALH